MLHIPLIYKFSFFFSFFFWIYLNKIFNGRLILM